MRILIILETNFPFLFYSVSDSPGPSQRGKKGGLFGGISQLVDNTQGNSLTK